MKKTIAILLAVALMMSLAATVFAAGSKIETGDGTASQVVKGTYTAKETKTVYSVDITWSNMEFTYNEAYKGEWNPSTHKDENATAASWTGVGTITVTNHSNTAIIAVPSYKANEAYKAAGMGFNVASLSVASADNGANGAAGTAQTGTITVTPNGSLPQGTKNAEIGTITITIE